MVPHICEADVGGGTFYALAVFPAGQMSKM